MLAVSPAGLAGCRMLEVSPAGLAGCRMLEVPLAGAGGGFCQCFWILDVGYWMLDNGPVKITGND
jgi:hypothetical protein